MPCTDTRHRSTGTRRGPVLLAAALVAAGCSGGDPTPPDAGDAPAAPTSSTTVTTTLPEVLPPACDTPPVTLRLEAGGPASAGGPAVTVTDAIAVRVPILPGASAADTPIEELIERAAETELALYSVFLADFPIDRSRLGGFTSMKPGPGQTLATLSIVPTSPSGFTAGDVVDSEGDFAFDTITTLAEMQLIVLSGEHPDALAGYDGAEGRIEILYLSDTTLCLDVDVEFSRAGEMVYAARGTFAVPVMEALEGFFFT